MAKMISLGLGGDDDPPKKPSEEPKPERRSLSGVIRALTRQSAEEKIDPKAEADRGHKLLRSAEISLTAAACPPEEKVRVLAGLVRIKESVGIPSLPVLQLAREVCEQIHDDAARAFALVQVAQAERASGQLKPPALTLAKARVAEKFSCAAARARAEMALLEFELKLDPGATLRAAKQVLEPASSASEAATTFGAVALAEAQVRLDSESTFKRAFMFLSQESDPARLIRARAVIAGQLAGAGQLAQAQGMLDEVRAKSGDDAARAAVEIAAEMAVALVRERENDEAVLLLDKIPAAARLADRVRAHARVVAALVEKDEVEAGRKLMARTTKLVEQAQGKGSSLLGPLDDEAAAALAVAQASLGQLAEANASVEQAGLLKVRAQLDVILASARLGAKLIQDAGKR